MELVECVKCVCVWLEAVQEVRGLVDKRIGFALYQSCGYWGSVGGVSVFVLRWCAFRPGHIVKLCPGPGMS